MSSSSPPSFPYSFFPGTPVFVPPFSGNFRKIFPPNAYRPPDDEFRTLGISADFLESGRGFRKNSPFFVIDPRCPVRQPTLHTGYIGKKSTIRQRFSKKTSLFTLMTVLRLIRHTGYIWEQKRNPAEILRKNLHFFVASAVRDRFRTFGISAKKM